MDLKSSHVVDRVAEFSNFRRTDWSAMIFPEMIPFKEHCLCIHNEYMYIFVERYSIHTYQTILKQCHLYIYVYDTYMKASIMKICFFERV